MRAGEAPRTCSWLLSSRGLGVILVLCHGNGCPWRKDRKLQVRRQAAPRRTPGKRPVTGETVGGGAHVAVSKRDAQREKPGTRICWRFVPTKTRLAAEGRRDVREHTNKAVAGETVVHKAVPFGRRSRCVLPTSPHSARPCSPRSFTPDLPPLRLATVGLGIQIIRGVRMLITQSSDVL